MAFSRRPPSPERYETARRLLCRIRGVDPAAIDVCLTLWRFSDELSASFEAFYASHGLSRARGQVLVQLQDARAGLTPAQLADRAGATPANMTGLLRSLQGKRLIRRKRVAGDRRSHSIELTASGRRKVEALLPILARRLERISGALNPRQRTAMREACGRICAAARAMPERTAPGAVRRRSTVRR